MKLEIPILNIKCCVSRECIELLPCNSPPFYSYTFGVLFNGLLAELPAILDSFLPVPQVITWGWLVRGGWLGVVGSHKGAGKTHVKY